MYNNFMYKDYKERESNFELLRNVAMFMILMLHADVWAQGWPTAYELLDEKSGGGQYVAY